MAKFKIIQSSAGRFSLTGILDQKTVPKLWQKRNKLIAEDDNLILDLAGITHSDSAGLAFLTCLQSEVMESQQQLTFINIPNQLQQLIKLSRLEDVLNC